MTRLYVFAAICLLPAATAVGGGIYLPPVKAEQADSIHIPSGRNVGWNWQLSDGAGYTWDISSYGKVNNGTNDAYDGGMQLSVNGNSFSFGSAGRGSADRREVEIGPWSIGQVRVWRRIYIDPKLGYCRWIDIFENTGSNTHLLNLRYYSNIGGSTQVTYTTSGKTQLSKKDWGIITAEAASGSSRPAIVHIFASRDAKLKPSFRFTPNNDNLYYHVSLPVGAKKTVALCFFEAQRRPLGEAKKFLKAFNVTKEMQKVPPALRKIIVNIGTGSIVSIGRVELPRKSKHDLAVLRNGDEMLGTILNERFVVETFFGRLDLSADRVLGLAVPSASDHHVQVVLTDGQVVAGKLTSVPLRLKLVNGNEVSLTTAKIKSLAYRISPAKGRDILLRSPVVILRAGMRLFFRAEDLPTDFYTEYGSLKLQTEHLRTLLLDTPEGGLHRAVFRNGSVLSGLLLAENLKLKLDLGPQLAIRRHVAAQFLFPVPVEQETNENLTELVLRNENSLFGRLADPSLNVRTKVGNVQVKPETIAEVKVPAESFGQVQIRLHNGTTVSGRLAGQTIRFKIEPGPELKVFVNHVRQIACPPPKPPQPQPTTPLRPHHPLQNKQPHSFDPDSTPYRSAVQNPYVRPEYQAQKQYIAVPPPKPLLSPFRLPPSRSHTLSHHPVS